MLFGTVQSVLFAGLGAVFARHVLRERADTAERHANIAADRAERAADRADRLVQEAANGRALAAMIRAEATTLLPAGFTTRPRGAGLAVHPGAGRARPRRPSPGAGGGTVPRRLTRCVQMPGLSAPP